MKTQQAAATVVTLANANALVCGIVQAVIGNDVADSVDGSVLTQEAICALAQSRIQMKLKTHRGDINAQ